MAAARSTTTTMAKAEPGLFLDCREPQRSQSTTLESDIEKSSASRMDIDQQDDLKKSVEDKIASSARPQLEIFTYDTEWPNAELQLLKSVPNNFEAYLLTAASVDVNGLRLPRWLDAVKGWKVNKYIKDVREFDRIQDVFVYYKLQSVQLREFPETIDKRSKMQNTIIAHCVLHEIKQGDTETETSVQRCKDIVSVMQDVFNYINNLVDQAHSQAAKLWCTLHTELCVLADKIIGPEARLANDDPNAGLLGGYCYILTRRGIDIPSFDEETMFLDWCRTSLLPSFTQLGSFEMERRAISGRWLLDFGKAIPTEYLKLAIGYSSNLEGMQFDPHQPALQNMPLFYWPKRSMYFNAVDDSMNAVSVTTEQGFEFFHLDTLSDSDIETMKQYLTV